MLGGFTVHENNPESGMPEDATQATEEQRDMQEKLDHADDDPNAPARSQTYRDIPDEN